MPWASRLADGVKSHDERDFGPDCHHRLLHVFDCRGGGFINRLRSCQIYRKMHFGSAGKLQLAVWEL